LIEKYSLEEDMIRKDRVERNVNLDHHIPSASLLSTIDYQKVPKSEEAQLHKKDNMEYRDFLPDVSGLSIWDRLRKPEFQRATSDWDDNKILSLLETMRDNQVIPGVILWLNTQTSHIFVLDGAHRLSVIRAWITEDWGDTNQAKQYGYVEESELQAAKRIRSLVNNVLGSHADCQSAGKKFRQLVDNNKKPSDYMDPAEEARGRFMYNLNTALRIPIQWVTGDYETAEQSFININTGGTPLSDQEVNFLQNRRSPVARAISGIVANGTKPTLWIKHKDECNQISAELYNLLLESSDASSPERVADYPLCLVKKQKNFDRYMFVQNILSVAEYGETGEDNLRALIAEYANEIDEDIVSDKTLSHLRNAKSLIAHIHGNQSQSLGFYPAFYFYTNKGQYKDFLFLLFLSWVSRGTAEDIISRKIHFTQTRDMFEEVWMIGKEWIFKTFGRKGAGPARLSKSHTDILQSLIDQTSKAKENTETAYDVLDKFLKGQDAKIHSEFAKEFKREKGKPRGKFLPSVKLQSEFLTLFNKATERCAICGGRVQFGSHQVDHITKRASGGSSSVTNASFIHPFCNNHKDRLINLRQYNPILKTSEENQVVIEFPTPQPDSDVTQLTFNW